MLAIYGNQKYDENMEILGKLDVLDVAKGAFQAMDDIDSRQKNGPSNYNNAPLHKGFDIQCGLKGGKLSGG